MQNCLRVLCLVPCWLLLVACSSGPKPAPESTTIPATVTIIEPQLPHYVQPQSVAVKHDWLQRRQLHAHMQAALLEIDNMQEVLDKTVPAAVIESQSYLLLMSGGENVAEYEQILQTYTRSHPTQVAVWSGEAALSQFSMLLSWQVGQLVNQMDLDYARLQTQLRSYLQDSLELLPTDYDLAISLDHDDQTQASLLMIEGAVQTSYMAEMQARLLAALHTIEEQPSALSHGYGEHLIAPALAARNGPLVRFILRPTN